MMFHKFFQKIFNKKVNFEQTIVKAKLVSSEGLDSTPKEINSSGWKAKKKQIKNTTFNKASNYYENQIDEIYSHCLCGGEIDNQDWKSLRDHTICRPLYDEFYYYKYRRNYKKRWLKSLLESIKIKNMSNKFFNIL